LTRWELTKFKVQKVNEGTFNSVINFETEIIVPETRKSFIFIFDGRQFIVRGFEFKPSYLPYEIQHRLESLLDSVLIRELSKHSRKTEYLRAFSLTKISTYPEGTLSNLRYVYNDKFLEFGSVLVIPPYKEPNRICKVPLTIETNAVSGVKSLYELLRGICSSAVRIYIDIKNVNEIIKILLQKIGI